MAIVGLQVLKLWPVTLASPIRAPALVPIAAHQLHPLAKAAEKAGEGGPTATQAGNLDGFLGSWFPPGRVMTVAAISGVNQQMPV